MMKKILALAGAGAMVLALVGPAFAGCYGWWCPPSSDLNVTNTATVTNNVDSWANTGQNIVNGGCLSKVWTKTGDAAAVSGVQNYVNRNSVGCACVNGSVKIDNKATVTNNVDSLANTGQNSVNGGWLSKAWTKTGDAVAMSSAFSVVNLNSVGF